MKNHYSLKCKALASLLLTFYNVAIVVVILTLITVYEASFILVSISWWYLLPIAIINCLTIIIVMSILSVDYFTWKYGLVWLINERKKKK